MDRRPLPSFAQMPRGNRGVSRAVVLLLLLLLLFLKASWSGYTPCTILYFTAHNTIVGESLAAWTPRHFHRRMTLATEHIVKPHRTGYDRYAVPISEQICRLRVSNERGACIEPGASIGGFPSLHKPFQTSCPEHIGSQTSNKSFPRRAVCTVSNN